MSSALLGLELRGELAVLTIVERDGSVAAAIDEPLDGPVEHWWNTHPAERYRAVLALLERALREGLLAGGKIAGIGLTCSHGLTLLDPDYEVLSDVPWGSFLDGTERTPGSALGALAEREPKWARRVGVVMSTLDYVRFRLTGALATHAGFAYSLGLTRPGAIDAWDHAGIEGLGLSPSMFPPVFRAPERVGVIGEEVVSRSGIPRGVWVNAGSEPVAAAIIAAGELRPGVAVSLAGPAGVELWRVAEAPASDDGAVAIPLAGIELWAYRDAGDAPVNGSGTTIVDWRDPDPPTWLDEVASEEGAEVSVAFDAGGPSAGAALQAGFGLGWWRDPRTLWRKKRAPQDVAEYRASRAEEADRAEEASRTEEGSVHGDE